MAQHEVNRGRGSHNSETPQGGAIAALKAAGALMRLETTNVKNWNVKIIKQNW